MTYNVAAPVMMYGSFLQVRPKPLEDGGKKKRRKPKTPSWQTVVQNEWSNDKDDCLELLQNGDHIVIFWENQHDVK